MDKYYDNGRPETVTGDFGTAWITTQDNDDETMKMVRAVMNSSLSENTKVVIMPDCHVGKGCVVGFTQKINEAAPRISPDIIGVDIGCNITSMKFKADPAFMESEETLAQLDAFARANIGIGIAAYAEGGLSAREKSMISKDDLKAFSDAEKLLKEDMPNPREKVTSPSIEHQLKSVGSGNHFIELGKDPEDGFYWLTVHSGSRYFGQRVCHYYKYHAVRNCEDNKARDYKYLDRSTPYMERYLTCVDACQRFSRLNHQLILNKLGESVIRGFSGKPLDYIGTMHNYIDLEHMIVRKGSVSALMGERLLIPFNMRDGVAVCEAKGNPEWNFSAPHGAGRCLSRAEAKLLLNAVAAAEDLKQHKVFSTSVEYSVDETPDAYKPMAQILELIKPTVDVKFLVKPIWNIKGRS